MNPNSSISHTVMQRVQRIHTMRMSIVPALSLVVFAGALWGVGREVWVAKVFENMPELSNIQAVSAFYLGAFIGTDLSVQILLIVAGGALIWLAKSLTSLVPSARFA